MQPMAAHKGYGLSILVDLLTGALANAATSMSGEIVSWCFELDKPNNVSHAFLVVNPEMFGGAQAYVQQNEQMAAALRRISSMRDSSASIVSFCVIKLTETFCTPPSLRIALSILAAQLAQSSPSSFQVFFIRQASFPSLIVRAGYVYKQDKAICRAAGYSATCSIPCPRMVRTCPSARE